MSCVENRVSIMTLLFLSLWLSVASSLFSSAQLSTPSPQCTRLCSPASPCTATTGWTSQDQGPTWKLDHLSCIGLTTSYPYQDVATSTADQDCSTFSLGMFLKQQTSRLLRRRQRPGLKRTFLSCLPRGWTKSEYQNLIFEAPLFHKGASIQSKCDLDCLLACNTYLTSFTGNTVEVGSQVIHTVE